MNDISDVELAKLSEWTRDAFDAVVCAGYIVPPWRPSDAMQAALAGYYSAGLTPVEGAEALFATRQ